MKNNILLLAIKGLTVTLIMCFWLALLFDDFVWENWAIIIVPLLILNTVSFFVTFLYRMNLRKTIFLGVLFIDIVMCIFLIYYLRLFLVFEEI